MAPVNIAGQPIAVTSELRRQGLDVSLLQYTAGEGHKYGYPGDQVVNIKGRHRVEAETETLAAALAAGYDIFHFWMSTFFGGRRYANMYGLDLPFIKARGRHIVYRGTGFDLRVKSRHIALNPHHPFQHGYELEIDEQAQLAYLAYLKDYVDQFVVQDPEMHEFMPEARVIPRAMDLDRYEPVGVAPNERPLIVHAPSKGLVKGTPILMRALDELREEGLAFELKVITEMPHEQAMGWYRKADLIVDQLLLGWYGVLTLEGLALGKPVVVYVRDDLYESFTPRIPIANANPDTLKDVLRPLIADYEQRRAVAEHGPAFVRQVHDVRTVAAQLRELYEEVLARPVRQPEGYSDLRHFVAQFKIAEALDERRTDRFKSRKYDELLQELPRLRFKANKYEQLLSDPVRLRPAPAPAPAAPAPATSAPGTPVAAPLPELDEQQVAIERGLLRDLRNKAREYDRVADELPRLRYQAKRADELFEEVKALRYKASQHDALREEVLALRFKVQQQGRGRDRKLRSRST
jgi:glycosyltransferase involved in cell wall biosynthesis